jgi:hypothetical protein
MYAFIAGLSGVQPWFCGRVVRLASVGTLSEEESGRTFISLKIPIALMTSVVPVAFCTAGEEVRMKMLWACEGTKSELRKRGGGREGGEKGGKEKRTFSSPMVNLPSAKSFDCHMKEITEFERDISKGNRRTLHHF